MSNKSSVIKGKLKGMSNGNGGIKVKVKRWGMKVVN